MSTFKVDTIIPHSGNVAINSTNIAFNDSVTCTGIKFPDDTTQTSGAEETNSSQLFNAWVACGEAGDHAPTTIKGSYNVSSVTESSTCHFYVHFLLNMVDNDYVVCPESTQDGNYTSMNTAVHVAEKTTSQVHLRTGWARYGGGCYGSGTLNVIVIGNGVAGG